MKRSAFRINNEFSFRIFTTIILCLTANQLLPQSAENSANSLEFEKYGNQVIATIGKVELTAQEFLLNYEFGPAFVKRMPESKKKYLDLMIYEKILAMDGYTRGLDQEESVIRSCTAYEEDIITEELFKDEVMDKVSVSEDEITSALPEEQKKISLRWLFTKKDADIFIEWNALEHGASFDSLYAEQLNDTVPADDRSMHISSYRLSKNNPVLACVIDTLSAGNYTKPIKVTDGWYIVKVDQIFSEPVMTETGLDKLRHELERSIYKQKLDIMSDIYVKEMMTYYSPQIDRNTFREVVYYINKTARYPNSFDRASLDEHLTAENDQETDPEPAVQEQPVLVYGKSIRISLDEFIDWYRPRMAYLKFPEKTAVAFILAVQKTVWRMVRDILLVKKARALRLDQRESVRKQVKWWRDKIVYNAVKAEIMDSVTFTTEDLSDYYQKNRKDYLYSDGRIIPFEKARGNVQSDYIREKYMSEMMRRIIKLKAAYDIQINELVLAGIDVQDEEDPKTIDFYAVKKGGLLPRQPYPTIDWDWQVWY